jgi:hypothetical protein
LILKRRTALGCAATVADKNPRGWLTSRGVRNHRLCQYIRGQSDMAINARD